MNKSTSMIMFLILAIINIFVLIKSIELVDPVLIQNLIFNLVALNIIIFTAIGFFIHYRVKLLDPIVFILGIYTFMFFVTPIYDIINNEILWFGVNLFSEGIKGTLFALMGYFGFVFGYFFRFSIKRKRPKELEESNCYNRTKAAYISMFGWVFCFFISMLYFYLNMGFNVIYIFAVGLFGNVDKSITSSTALGSLYMFSFSLLPLSMIYFTSGKSKLLKLLIFWMTLSIHLTMGFRHVILTYLFAIAIHYFLSNNKKVKLKYIAIALIGAILLIGMVEGVRNDIRAGNQVSMSSFSMGNSIESVFNNFRIYKTYYGVIKAVPKFVGYMYFDQMLIYTAIMLIPRGIWPAKPGATGIEAMAVGISEYAAAAGQAYPNLGEFYYSFGIAGVVIFMYVYGYIASKFLQILRMNRSNSFNIILYSLFLPANLQLVIRGYLPGNLYYMIFLLVPIVIVKKLVSYKKIEGIKK